MTSEIQIPAFTATCLLLTTAILLAALLVAWYTVRRRIKLSQVILGLFCYVVVMMAENLFDTMALWVGLRSPGFGYGLYSVVAVVAAREIVRYFGVRYGVRGSFDDTDAAIGFGLGFGGLYLAVCAAYYFNCYTAVAEYLKVGYDAFVVESGANAEEALELLRTVSQQTGIQFVVTGLNRVFFLVREIALSVLLWYTLSGDGKRIFLILIPVMHLVTILPDGLYQAEIITNTFIRDGAICVLTAGIAFLAARQYNKNEDQVAHFQVERLRARKQR